MHLSRPTGTSTCCWCPTCITEKAEIFISSAAAGTTLSSIFWRRYSQEMLDKVVPAAADEIKISAFSVIHVGHQQHVEVPVGLDKCIHESHGLDRIYIVVNVAVDQ